MPKKIKVVDVASNNEIVEEPKPTDNLTLPTGKATHEEDTNIPPNAGEITDIEEEPKPKSKSKPRAKKPPVEVMQAVQEEIKDEPNISLTQVGEQDKTNISLNQVVKQEQSREEPKQDNQPIKEKIKKEIELVKCPRCDKLMQAKSLRYTHEANCKGIIPIKTEERPVKRREPKEIKQDIKQYNNQDIKQNSSIIVDPEIQNIILKTIENQKLKQKAKEDNFKKLISKIA